MAIKKDYDDYDYGGARKGSASSNADVSIIKDYVKKIYHDIHVMFIVFIVFLILSVLGGVFAFFGLFIKNL